MKNAHTHKCGDAYVKTSPGQLTDSNRAARREIKRQQQREQRERPFARVAKNGFGGQD